MLLTASKSERETILVTGAAGKTGLAILRRLATRASEREATALSIRALVRRAEQRRAIESLGAIDVHEGDLCDPASLATAVEGTTAVYHICPNVHPQETKIGHTIIALAEKTGVEHFVLHSVLHPQSRAMPHHRAKLMVEENLLESGLQYTILQPAPYMQNILGQWPAIQGEGCYTIPYATSTRVVMVDLEDVAEAAVRVLTQPGHGGAVYELAGGELLDQTEIASELARRFGRDVEARVLDRSKWASGARASGMSDHQIETLLAMFRYYERFGMAGNATVLAALLDRPPTRFSDFVDRARRTSESAESAH